MSDTILDLRQAKEVLNLVDDDAARDAILQETLLPAVDDLIEQHVGWVVKRDRTFTIRARQHGQSAVLPGDRVIAVAAASADGVALDISTIRVDSAGVITAAPGATLPLGEWSITVTSGFEKIPAALRLAAGELLVTAWENYRSEEPNAFVISYRAEAWLLPFSNGATFA